MKLKEKIEDMNQEMKPQRYSMSELIKLVDGERATSGNRAKLEQYLRAYNISYDPNELPSSSYSDVTLSRINSDIDTRGSESNSQLCKKKIVIADDKIIIEINVDDYASLKNKTLKELIGF